MSDENNTNTKPEGLPEILNIDLDHGDRRQVLNQVHRAVMALLGVVGLSNAARFGLQDAMASELVLLASMTTSSIFAMSKQGKETALLEDYINMLRGGFQRALDLQNAKPVDGVPPQAIDLTGLTAAGNA